MEANNYLTQKLNDLIKTIPEIRIRYYFDRAFSNHIIEITPVEVYKNDLNYSEMEGEISNDFASEFPNQTIVFISKDDIISIDKPDIILTGKLFQFDWPLFDWFNFSLDGLIKAPVEGENCGEIDYALAA